MRTTRAQALALAQQAMLAGYPAAEILRMVTLGLGGTGNRPPKAQWCPNCGQPTLVIPDRNTLEVVVDPAPLTRAGEVAALCLGGRTATVRILGGRLTVDHRDVVEVRAGLPRGADVHRVHRCAQPPVPGAERAQAATAAGIPLPVGDEPPF